ncbi:MAG TPA: hypothetical protein ENJ59_00135 [Thermofilum sp.]|nr:hypothetical protein [Thermofilum sp.]
MKCNIDVGVAFKVVSLILDCKTEEALGLLSCYYAVEPPSLEVGRPKGIGKALAVYVAPKKTIYLTRGEYMNNPFIILHEYYHHLRTFIGKHRGTERYAEKFALCIISKYLEAKEWAQIKV